MIAHMGHMANWIGATWAVFAVFLLLLAGGVVLLLRGKGSGGGAAHRILGERLARGEISPQEYRERSELVGETRSSAPGGVGAALVVVGLIGTLVVAAAGPGSGGGFMHGMMGGMGGMMGGGETGRSGSPPAEAAPEIAVAGGEFFFEPGQIRVETGETVNVTFDNAGMMFHTLTIGELGFDLRARGGESVAGALTAEEPGTYSFICAVPGHADAGMRGTLTVS